MARIDRKSRLDVKERRLTFTSRKKKEEEKEEERRKEEKERRKREKRRRDHGEEWRGPRGITVEDCTHRIEPIVESAEKL